MARPVCVHSLDVHRSEIILWLVQYMKNSINMPRSRLKEMIQNCVVPYKYTGRQHGSHLLASSNNKHSLGLLFTLLSHINSKLVEEIL